jgi:lipopolysaccharide export system permease protein
MKKIDKLLLGAFAGPFLMTFLVVVFILLTQHMLKYFDDIIGKGLGGDVIGQLLFYFAIFMTPVALPLAVLLSSLIAFGNLGEHFELTAIKSSGISLVRTLRPIFFFVIILTCIAFYANNNLVPKAALEAYSLLYDIKQKKPALDLREGAFYNGISDISIKVNKKFEDGITLKDVVVYDHRKNDGNKEVTIADSGKMYTILNERYLKFELFNGYNYSEGAASQGISGKNKSKTESLSRSKFDKSQIVFDLSDLDIKRTDKKWFQGNRIMRNLAELNSDMDSIKSEILSQRLSYYQHRALYFSYFKNEDPFKLPPELERHMALKDSLLESHYTKAYLSHDKNPLAANPKEEKVISVLPKHDTAKVILEPERPQTEVKSNAKKRSIVKRKDSNLKRDSLLAHSTMKGRLKKTTPSKKSVEAKQVKAQADSVALLASNDSTRRVVIDSLFNADADYEIFHSTTNTARQIKATIQNTNAGAESFEKEMIIFKIQWHKILSSSLACIAMFLIGAPLGAIIKKGGLGMPFLVSIIFFIIYYIISMQGEKLAKQAILSPAAGVWLADGVLFIIGFLFLRQARADARLFEADFYNVILDKFKTWYSGRKSRLKAQPVG